MLMYRLPFAALVLAFLLGACGAATPRGDTTPRGAVRFTCEQETAWLEINAQRLGPIGMFHEHGVLLPAGEHRILVRHDGFFDHYQLLTVVPDTVQMVSIELRAIPD